MQMVVKDNSFKKYFIHRDISALFNKFSIVFDPAKWVIILRIKNWITNENKCYK